MCTIFFTRLSTHNFYIGVDQSLVESAGTSSSVFHGTFSDGQNVFTVPDSLSTAVPGRTFFWRVDGINEAGKTFKGDVWSFTVNRQIIPFPVKDQMKALFPH